MPPFVEPLDVVVASQEAVSGLQFTPEDVQEVTRKVAPPVVDLAHYNVSGALGAHRGKCCSVVVHSQAIFTFALNNIVVTAFADLKKTEFPHPTQE